MARVVMVVLAIAVTVYAVADCARTPAEKVPGKLPKPLLLMLIILFSPIGGIAWIVISRVAAAEAGDGQVRPTVWSSPESAVRVRPQADAPATPVAPDDDPDFLWELEKQLHRQRQQQPGTAPVPPDRTSSANDNDEDSATESPDSDEDAPDAPPARS